MKRILSIFILIFVVAILGWSGWRYLEKKESQTTFVQGKTTYQEITGAIGVSKDKMWTIDFNNDLKSHTVDEKSIFVVDRNNKKIPVVLQVDDHSVNIQPPKKLYEPGESYTLYVEDTVELKNDENLKKPMKMEFTIERDEKEEVKLNPNIIKIPIVDVNRLDEEKADVVVNSETEKLKAGDIVFFPPNRRDPLQQEQARKIVSVNKKENSIEIHTNMPRFTELIEKLNIYKEIDFTAADFIPNPEFDVTAEDVATLQNENLVASLVATAPKRQADIQLIKGDKQKKKFEKDPNLRVKHSSNAIKLEGRSIEWEVKGQPFSMDITATMYKPHTIWDVEASFLKIEKMNIGIEAESSIEVNNHFGFEKKLEAEAGLVLEKDKKDKEPKKILLGTMAVPIASPVIVSLDVYAYVDINIKGEIEAKLSVENSRIATITKQKNKDYSFTYQSKFHDGDISLRGIAAIDEQLGVMINPQLSIAKAVGVGMELKGGIYEEGTIIADVNSETAVDGCYRMEGGTVLSGSVVVDIASRFVLYEKEISETKSKKDFLTLDQCSNKKQHPVLIAKPKELSMNPNDVTNLKMFLGYLDYETFSYKEEELSVDKLNFISDSTENVNVSNVGKVRVSENPTKKQTNIKVIYKEDGAQLSTTVPINVKIPKQVDKEMQNHILGLFQKIQPIIYTGETYVERPEALPPFETVQDSLKPFATTNYINNKLRNIYKTSIGWLDYFGTPYNIEPASTKTLKEEENEREYEWLINSEADGASKFLIRLKKENNVWKIDDCQKTRL
ncbi:TPA: Ig-like domain-containing protein [Bacillus cereus]|nr:Ig-like domain-containing protein [Bacillus cereus]